MFLVFFRIAFKEKSPGKFVSKIYFDIGPLLYMYKMCTFYCTIHYSQGKYVVKFLIHELKTIAALNIWL